jgi:hypothetical protein
MAPNLCPHRLNPQSCLKCFHARKPEPKRERPLGNANGVPMAALPGTKAAPVLGDRAGAHLGVPMEPRAVDPAARAKHRGEALNRVLQPSAGAPVMREPVRTTDDSAAYDPNKLWTPPARQQVMDQLPSHPQAGRR